MIRLSDILDEVGKYHPDADFEQIKKAYVFSAKLHEGQIRKDGAPYVTHPLEVAHILAQLKLDDASIMAGILHDTVEDTVATKADIAAGFGNEVADIVDGVTKLGQYTSQTTSASPEGATKSKEAREEEKQAENFRKMLIAMAKDIRVILVKLADRTHNMRTLDHMKPDKQIKIAQETLDIYAPLANRLGISWIKIELEDYSFRYLRPTEFLELSTQIAKTQKEREKYIQDVVKLLEDKLKEAKLVGQVSGRPKHLYSVYKKMKQKNVPLESVHDLVAFRVIVPTLAECYQTLGMVHGVFKPLSGRFKDFIAIPKPNNYQSLHTTVIGPGGDLIEIQIRTEDMHQIAEEGIAAHWAYKEGKPGVFNTDEQKFAWLRQLMDWQKELKDPKEFLDSVKVDLFSDECFVFTPKGDVKALPRGATPVDFAYAIHSKVGDRCVGAKANGKIVPLRHKLKDGDVVEVLTSTTAHPSKDWLTYVKTAKAQNRIRAFIRQQEREKSIDLGRDLGEREFRRYGLSFPKLAKEENGVLIQAAHELGCRSIEDLEAALGIGKVVVSQIIARIAPEKLAEPKSSDESSSVISRFPGGTKLTEIFKKVISVTGGKGKGGVQINGIDDVLVRFGRCCAPVPGDQIAGYITRGRGVSVHVRDCPKLQEAEPERRVDVAWDVKANYTRPVTLKVTSDDRAGLLAKMSDAFSARSISIVQANARALSETKAVSTFEVGIKDLGQLKDVMAALQKLPGVHSVERM
jgi:guanosine-3',5'-bis(diphosphate) 3'-pyrophosphohydrolase